MELGPVLAQRQIDLGVLLLFLNSQVCVSISSVRYFVQISVKSIPACLPLDYAFTETSRSPLAHLKQLSNLFAHKLTSIRKRGDTGSKLPACLLPERLVELPLILTVPTIRSKQDGGEMPEGKCTQRQPS